MLQVTGSSFGGGGEPSSSRPLWQMRQKLCSVSSSAAAAAASVLQQGGLNLFRERATASLGCTRHARSAHGSKTPSDA